MQRQTLYIIATGLAAGLVSMLYFLSLTVALPFVVTVAVAIVCVVFFVRFIRSVPVDDEPLVYPNLVVGILVIACVMLVQKSSGVSEKYGGWDAWAIWNMHAKFLVSKEHWRNLFLNTTYGHPDYPMLLPGFIAFFGRMFAGRHMEIISFIFNFSITLFIPVLIYFETIKKNILVAAAVLFLYINDKFFVFQGVSSYADTAVGFFFLCAFICMCQEDYHHKWAAIAGGCLGCCMWTKNEGVILTIIFTLFYLRLLIRTGGVKYFLAGLALPLLTLLVFKIGYAPANDLIAGQSSKTLMQAFDWSRYSMIYKSFTSTMNEKYYWVVVIFLLHILALVFKKKWPDKQLTILITCLAAYFMVYVFSTQGLEWHLSTSVDRLLHQLMPAMVYVIAGKFAGAGGVRFDMKSSRVM